MRIPYKVLTLLLACFLTCGFTHKAKDVDYSSRHHISSQQHTDKKTHSLMRRAHKAVGTPYVYGGESLAGFDCSGFVRWTYKSVGINLPRTAREQSLLGYRIMDVSKMRAGDIVAFRRSGGGYHTGIYIGDGRFIHAPRTNSRERQRGRGRGGRARGHSLRPQKQPPPPQRKVAAAFFRTLPPSQILIRPASFQKTLS